MCINDSSFFWVIVGLIMGNNWVYVASSARLSPLWFDSFQPARRHSLGSDVA